MCLIQISCYILAELALTVALSDVLVVIVGKAKKNFLQHDIVGVSVCIFNNVQHFFIYYTKYLSKYVIPASMRYVLIR